MDLTAILTPGIILLVCGVVLGLVLGIADKFLKVIEDSRIDTIEKLLPGFNCGACGTPGCRANATAILAGETKIRSCKPMKDEHYNNILNFLSNPEESSDPEGNAFPHLSQVK